MGSFPGNQKMKTLVIDTVNSGRKLCSLAVFSEHKFQYHHFAKLDSPELSSADITKVCFNAHKFFSLFGESLGLVYDVETLYALSGRKFEFENLIELGEKIFGRSKLEKYTYASNRVNANLRAYRLTKIDPSKYDLDQLIPTDLIQDLYLERSKIIYDLFKEINDQDLLNFYNKFQPTQQKICGLSKQLVSVDLDQIKEFGNYPGFQTIKSQQVNGKVSLYFKPVGAKTGRLSCKKNTVNMLTLPKELRKAIVAEPKSQLVQYDFKSFQPRLAICLTMDQEFKNKFLSTDDVYGQFSGERDKNKIDFLHWMFGTEYEHDVFAREAAPILALRKRVCEEARAADGKVTNIFGRPLYFNPDDSNSVIFQNLITSTEVDTMLSVFSHLVDFLKPRKSKILFPIHDALVLQIFDDEQELIPRIRELIENFFVASVFFARFPVDVKRGKNLGELHA
jgi:hypothetical protein